MQLRTAKPLDTALRTPSMSSFPNALATVFSTPLPTPKSANEAIANTELMVIHSPKRSLPKYLNVRGTVIKDVPICTTRASVDMLPVSTARRFLSAPRETSVKTSGLRGMSNFRKYPNVDAINRPPYPL